MIVEYPRSKMTIRSDFFGLFLASQNVIFTRDVGLDGARVGVTTLRLPLLPPPPRKITHLWRRQRAPFHPTQNKNNGQKNGGYQIRLKQKALTLDIGTKSPNIGEGAKKSNPGDCRSKSCKSQYLSSKNSF